VNCRVRELVIALQLLAIMLFKGSVNPIISPTLSRVSI
jgi:hypothetical protein